MSVTAEEIGCSKMSFKIRTSRQVSLEISDSCLIIWVFLGHSIQQNCAVLISRDYYCSII